MFCDKWKTHGKWYCGEMDTAVKHYVKWNKPAQRQM